MKKKLIKISIVLVILLTLTILYATLIEPHTFKTKEVNIINNSINTFHGFKVLQFSDLHYGSTTGIKELNKLTKEINLLKPNIIVFTGDLIDPRTILTDQVKEEVITFLKSLNADFGKYAISGNHDLDKNVYSDVLDNDLYKDILLKSNFNLIDNKYDIIYNNFNEKLLIAGINTNNPVDITNSINEENLNYKILILHEPDFIDNINYQYFNLIMAGHSHNGQIRIPFLKPILPKGSQKYYKEHYDLGTSTDLYISSGIGTSIIRARLLSDPSITFYRITKKSEN